MQRIRITARTVAFAAIILIMCWFSVGYAAEIYETQVISMLPEVPEDTSLFIDGSDFTLFAKMAKVFLIGMEGIWVITILSLYSLIVLIVSLIMSAVFRIAAVRKNAVISADEYMSCKYVFIGAAVLSVILGMILTHLTGVLYLIMLTVMWVAPSALFCISPMRERVRAAAKDNTCFENPQLGHGDV